MNPQLANAFLVTLKGQSEKDAQRFKWFFEDVGKKQAELVTEALQNPNAVRTLTIFNQDVWNLTLMYINRAAQVGKSPWKYVFSDPFKGEREQVRQFARRWDFRQELR